MAQVELSPVDEFTADITIPENGDLRNIESLLPALQGLTNRTYHHKGRLDDHAPRIAALEAEAPVVEAVFSLNSPGNVAFGAKFPLSVVSSYPSGSWNLVSSTDIEVPQPGLYVASLIARLTSTDLNAYIESDVELRFGTFVAGKAGGSRWTATAAHKFLVSGMSQINAVSGDLTTQRVNLFNQGVGVNPVTASSKLLVRRLGPIPA